MQDECESHQGQSDVSIPAHPMSTLMSDPVEDCERANKDNTKTTTNTKTITQW